MASSPHASRWTWLPPPVGFATAFLLGWLVQRIGWPDAPAAATAVRALGMAFVAVGGTLGLSAIALFVVDRTTVIPHGRPTRFVARGPYRWTRNPMYVGLSAAYLGLAAWTGTWLAIPFLALPIVHLSRWIIPMEEAWLLELSGEPYQDYRRRVRRWL